MYQKRGLKYNNSYKHNIITGDMVKAKDFESRDPIVSQTWGLAGMLDYGKVVELKDEDFAQLYLELMNEYKTKNKWWGKAGIPRCRECEEEIPSPRELRRYEGKSMHPACFKQFYEREGKDRGLMRKYWQRVSRLVLN